MAVEGMDGHGRGDEGVMVASRHQCTASSTEATRDGCNGDGVEEGHKTRRKIKLKRGKPIIGYITNLPSVEEIAYYGRKHLTTRRESLHGKRGTAQRGRRPPKEGGVVVVFEL